jgi:hypothetical protein
VSSTIKDDDLDHKQEILHLDRARHDKSLHTIRVPLPKQRSSADSVIARLPHSISQHPPGATPPLVKHQKSSLLNQLFKSDRAPSARPLVVPIMSSGDQNSPQPNTSSDQNVHQHQTATFDVAEMFMEEIVFTKIPWPILSDN